MVKCKNIPGITDAIAKNQQSIDDLINKLEADELSRAAKNLLYSLLRVKAKSTSPPMFVSTKVPRFITKQQDTVHAKTPSPSSDFFP